MDDEDEDAGVVELAWKAALDAAEDDAKAEDEAEEGEDEDAFATLDAALGSYAAAPPPEEPSAPSPPPSAPPLPLPPPSPAAPAPGARLKRKNFSKELQLLSLQRYAAFARASGRLPSRQETLELLRRSFEQFLQRGGAPDEPRLTPPEFLKLIRNRRREIHARAQAVGAPPGRSKARKRSTEAKRRLQDENDKIRELIETIDRVRARTQPRAERQRVGARPEVEDEEEEEEEAAVSAQDTVEAILQAQAETREVQRELAERVESIQRMLLHHDGMEEPSSASV